MKYTRKFEIRDIRDGRFLWMDKAALKYVTRRSGPSGAVVYAWLCYYANTHSQDSWPSISTLQKDTSLGRMTVIRSLNKLVEIRAIEIKKTSGTYNIYTLLEIQEELAFEAVPKRDQSQIGTSTITEGTSTTPIQYKQDDKSNKMREVPAHKKFQKPSVEDVKAYCVERKNNIDPEAFWDHYETRNWVPKGYTKQMSSWKAAVRTWEKKEGQYGAIGGGNGKLVVNFKAIESRIECDLGKMATDNMVKKVMREIPPKAWFLVDKYIKKRYPQGDHGQFGRIEAELVREMKA